MVFPRGYQTKFEKHPQRPGGFEAQLGLNSRGLVPTRFWGATSSGPGGGERRLGLFFFAGLDPPNGWQATPKQPLGGDSDHLPAIGASWVGFFMGFLWGFKGRETRFDWDSVA